jgi:hypothetical protein
MRSGCNKVISVEVLAAERDEQVTVRNVPTVAGYRIEIYIVSNQLSPGRLDSLRQQRHVLTSP